MITPEKVLKAAKLAAHNFGFDDSYNAYWQCNLFSNAVVKIARLYDIYDLQLVLVMATWKTPVEDIEVGDQHKHVLIQYGETYYDFTIRQINEKAPFPLKTKKLPKYLEFIDYVDIEDLSDDDFDYMKEILKYLDPSAELETTTKVRRNPRKKQHGIIGDPPIISHDKDGLDDKAKKINGYLNCRLFAQLLIDVHRIEDLPIVTSTIKVGDILWWGDNINGYRHVAVYAGNDMVWQVDEWGAEPRKIPLSKVIEYWDQPDRIYQGSQR